MLSYLTNASVWNCFGQDNFVSRFYASPFTSFLIFIGAYFKNAEKTRTGHGSKTQTHQQQFDEPEPEPSLTWERRSCATLTESQSSLASRASSAGGRTQSTNLSGAEQRDPGNSANRSAERRARGERRKGKRGDEAKNTVVSANGDNVETTLTY